MMGLLLAISYFWWDANPDADYYRVCWSAHPSVYSECDCARTGQELLLDNYDDPVIPTPEPGELFYIVVQACNAAGCGGTGHGPVEACP